MFEYIYYTTAAGYSISSQLGSSYQVNRYNVEKAGGTPHLGLPSKFPSKKNSSEKARNGFCYSAEKNAPFMELHVSWNSQFQGLEQNAIRQKNEV
jgi:hypothetical protein